MLSKRDPVQKLERRLDQLERSHGGLFYFENGVIRHRTLHPTKGWRDQRWERWEPEI